MVVQMYHWVGPALKPQLANLKPVQVFPFLLPLGPLGPKGYCRPLCAPPPPPHTLFWLLHQYGATDSIHNTYKLSTPLCTFFTQSQGLRSKVKVKDLKKSCLGVNLKNNYWISPIFNVKLPMSMEIT